MVIDSESFDRSFATERRLLYYSGLLLFAILIVCEVLSVVGGSALQGILLAVRGSSFLIIGLVGLVLLRRYRSLPLVREKQRLESEFRPICKAFDGLSAKIDQAERTRDSIEAEKQARIEQRKWAHSQQLTRLEKQRLQIRQAREKEISDELLRLQTKYVADGLRASSVAHAKMQGVGPKLKSRLIRHGIRSAAEITAARVDAVQGFGAVKTNSVLGWRAQVEANLKRRMPRQLPSDTESSIRQRCEQKLSQVALDQKSAEEALTKDLATIRESASLRHTENDVREAEAKGQRAELNPEYDNLASQLDTYSGINPVNYLLGCLQGTEDRPRALRRCFAILIPLVFVSSLLCQGSASLRAVVIIALETSPKATPALALADVSVEPPTDTALPVPSATETSIPVLTDTRAAVAVPTRTVPLTGTSTRTPTPVPTPTFTPIPGSPGVDLVVAYNPGSGVLTQYSNAAALLGDPDLIEHPCCEGMVQLGRRGSVLVAFSDNVAIDEQGADLQVFGESARDDYLLVEVSADGKTWRAYPKMSESPGALDLADVGLAQVVYVRLTDIQPATDTGAELDAVIALHSRPAPQDDLPPLPEAVAREDLTLYEGPDARMAKVGVVAAGSPVTIEGRGRAAGWVKVKTRSNMSGWCKVTGLGLNVALKEYAVASAPPTPSPTAVPTRYVLPVPTRYCCKICVVGKACGNTCISRSYTCHQPPGCACNSW